MSNRPLLWRLWFFFWRLVVTCRCAPRVTAPWAFAVNGISRRSGVFRYRLRGTELVLHTRHSWLDDLVFDEVFRQRLYEPPQQVVRILDSLRHPPRIVDLGGHLGFAALCFLRRYPDAKLIAFEPDPGNAQILRQTVTANGLQDSWQVVEACAGTKSTTVPFVAGAGARSHLPRVRGLGPESVVDSEDAAMGGEEIRVAAQDALPLIATAELLKIDIEGGEWKILEDERFADAAPPTLALEYHARGDLAAGTADIRTLLGKAGYVLGPIRERPGLGDGTLWAWRG